MRGRLIWGVGLLAAAAVLGAQTAGIAVLHTWLLNRADEQLTSFPDLAETVPPPPSGTAAVLPSDFQVVRYDVRGRRGETIGHGGIPGPELPATTAGLPAASRRPATVPAVSGDGDWRISVRTTIQGFAQLAMRAPDWDPAERREADRVIARDAERMSLLIDDLLLLARLDREPTYRDDEVDLSELAADAIGSAAPHGAGHRLRLTTLSGDTDLEPAETRGDARRLHQIVANLLTNALRYTRPGTQVEVRVGTTVVSPETGGTDTPGRFSPLPPLPSGSPACVVEVADHGPGLRPEDATRVFERFYRVDTSRSRDRGGSGLGLAIAVTIARSHGGRLEVDTGPDQGAVFRLVLPTTVRLAG